MAEEARIKRMVKLTKSPVSDSLDMILSRLEEGHHVDLDIIMRTPEMRLVQQCLSNAPTPTDKLDPESRRSLHNNILRRLQSAGSYTGTAPGEDGNNTAAYDGIVAREREIHIVMGLPASGKSSALTDILSKEFSGKVLDSDMVKEMIPEFNDGWGASVVHEESKQLLNQAFEDSLALGENVIVPRIGEPPENVLEMIETAKAAGYKCYVHMMDLDPHKAMGRMIGRFMATGRYVPLEIAAKYADPQGMNLMEQAFWSVAKSPMCDGYSLWSNDVPFGSPAILIDHDGIEGKFLDDAMLTIGRQPTGVEPESDIDREVAQNRIEIAVKRDQVAEARTAQEAASKRVRDLTSRDAAAAELKMRRMIEEGRLPDTASLEPDAAGKQDGEEAKNAEVERQVGADNNKKPAKPLSPFDEWIAKGEPAGAFGDGDKAQEKPEPKKRYKKEFPGLSPFDEWIANGSPNSPYDEEAENDDNDKDDQPEGPGA